MKRFPVLTIILLAYLTTTAFGFEDGELSKKYRPVIENIIASLENNDYNGFIRDLDGQMKERMTKENFEKKRAVLTAQVGKLENLNYMGRLEKKKSLSFFGNP